ncbi:hypothetical protein NWQ33_00660 [Mycoplasmopsis cynos]|nr:hypothetical protein [Mycoplasmopsis cynos]
MLSFTWIVLVELLLMSNKNELGILFWPLNSIAIFSGMLIWSKFLYVSMLFEFSHFVLPESVNFISLTSLNPTTP